MKACFISEQPDVKITSTKENVIRVVISVNGEWKERVYGKAGESQMVWECDYAYFFANKGEVDAEDVIEHPNKYLNWLPPVRQMCANNSRDGPTTIRANNAPNQPSQLNSAPEIGRSICRFPADVPRNFCGNSVEIPWKIRGISKTISLIKVMETAEKRHLSVIEKLFCTKIPCQLRKNGSCIDVSGYLLKMRICWEYLL